MMIQNQLFLSTRCVISRYQMLMKMSTVAPTFSSSGDNSKIVTRLGPNRVSTMIMTGLIYTINQILNFVFSLI